MSDLLSITQPFTIHSVSLAVSCSPRNLESVVAVFSCSWRQGCFRTWLICDDKDELFNSIICFYLLLCLHLQQQSGVQCDYWIFLENSVKQTLMYIMNMYM